MPENNIIKNCQAGFRKEYFITDNLSVIQCIVDTQANVNCIAHLLISNTHVIRYGGKDYGQN